MPNIIMSNACYYKKNNIKGFLSASEKIGFVLISK